ncbi:MAG TPA: hypothetical protein VMY76_10900 [Gemmatimonadales bacterium]|nr:hypothetical protein [Gemmatimonadales bacterium]
MSPEQIVTIIAIVTAAWTGNRIIRPIAEALARRIGPAESRNAEHEAEQSLQLADVRQRLSELEERLDFNERVLLQDRQAGQLPQADRP